MNYNELTPVQKHVVRAMHYIWLSKNHYRLLWITPIEYLFGFEYDESDRLFWLEDRCCANEMSWIHKQAYENECMRLAEIPKKIPGYTNERARREAKVVVDYVRGEYRRMK